MGSLWDLRGTSSDVGAVRVFEREATGAWTLSQLLQPPDVGARASGQGFSLDGDQIAIGVPWFFAPDRNIGAIYVYTRDPTGSWQTGAPILMAMPKRDDYLGRGVLLRGDHLFATSTELLAPTSVTLHIYRRQSDGRWLEIGRRLDPGAEAGYAIDGLEGDLQMAMASRSPVVGYPLRGYTGAAAPGAVVVFDVAGM